jgi:hypothetical protein
MSGPVSSAIGALDKGVETISDRAFEAVQRHEVRRGPTPQQKLLKKVQARTASQAETREAIGFGLVEEDDVTLTPLGEYLLSGYPEEAEPTGPEAAAEGSPETAAQ